LDIRPERILAVDGDTLKSPIQYSFVTGSPASFLDYFHIDPMTGTVRQIRPVVNDEETKFNVIVKVG
jgi:protocadherin-15